MKIRFSHIVLLMALAAGIAGSLVISGCGAPAKGTASASKTGSAQGQYAFWPLFPDDPHIQFLKSFGTSDDVSPSKASTFEKMVFGNEVEKTASINKPYGVAMKAGKIYVCDIRANSLVVLDLAKKQTRLVGASGVNHLVHPVAVAVADDGMIYVADNERGVIMVFDASERYSTSMGFEKFKPVAVAIHGDKVYACDIAGQAVQVFDRRTCKKTGSFGSVGDGDGQFRVPIGISVDAAGNIFVVDTMACRVQKFSPEGVFIASFGKLGDHVGTFARPKHMAVDSHGIAYVVDAAFQNVQMFDDQQRVLMEFGSAGDFPGAMNMPAGVCVSDEGLELFKDLVHPGFEIKRLVVVSNQFGDGKVSVYAMGELKKGWTAQQLSSVAAPVASGRGMDEDRIKLQQAVGELPPEGSDIPAAKPPESVEKPANNPK